MERAFTKSRDVIKCGVFNVKCHILGGLVRLLLTIDSIIHILFNIKNNWPLKGMWHLGAPPVMFLAAVFLIGINGAVMLSPNTKTLEQPPYTVLDITEAVQLVFGGNFTIYTDRLLIFNM